MVALSLSIPNTKAVYNSSIAKILGIPSALLLSRINWSIQTHIKSKDYQFFREDRWWMYSTKQDLMNYTGLSRHQVDLALFKLRDKGVLLTRQYDSPIGNMRNYYAIDHEGFKLWITKTPIIRKPDDAKLQAFSAGAVADPSEDGEDIHKKFTLNPTPHHPVSGSSSSSSKSLCNNTKSLLIVGPVDSVDKLEPPEEEKGGGKDSSMDSKKAPPRAAKGQVLRMYTEAKKKAQNEDYASHGPSHTEAMEVLQYYEAKFGQAGRASRVEFIKTYVSKACRKEAMLETIDLFYDCEYMLRPTTHSPMRLFHEKALIKERTTLRHKIISEITKAFNARGAVLRLMEDAALAKWFGGNRKAMNECILQLMHMSFGGVV